MGQYRERKRSIKIENNMADHVYNKIKEADITSMERALEGESLIWDLLKFCKGHKPNEIEIYTIRDGKNSETLLSHWEGKTKSEKVGTVAGILEVELYDEIDIVLPTGEVYQRH
ncbi:gp487 [Bacillus phage G]|uniref:Gp487 n=1 Tax=Bacillus phage G TaxID=2884420 RepID=G3MAM8_9CAUD|nr:gp487 [Bacillus phage G]AEO93745.1 gp487 [Bacillus phage G]